MKNEHTSDKEDMHLWSYGSCPLLVVLELSL